MITARIITEVRQIEVKCENNKDNAISALQESVKQLTKEDGRCKFIVSDYYSEIYSWYYQPTFREEKTNKKKTTNESKYMVGLTIYVLLNGAELNLGNFFHDDKNFDSVAEARKYMKEKGYSSYEYKIVYEYSVSSTINECCYGFGLGFTRNEAKDNLNKSIKYYSLEYKNNRVKKC